MFSILLKEILNEAVTSGLIIINTKGKVMYEGVELQSISI